MLIDSRYEVLEKLGESVWSTVYKVKDLRSGSIYALKLYQNLDSKTLYEKFSAEDMFIITKINHPNLVRVYNFGSFNNHIYSLSEFYAGSSLSEFLFSEGSIDDLYRIIVQICYGLHELHRRGIIHKDLKPDNIMYRPEDGKIRVKILDFGFSKVDLEKSQKHISGTLPYIAPEIFRGKAATIQSDFYSLGVTLYKIVTGSLPYTLEQLSDIITGTKTSVFPKFPSELNTAVPEKLEKLILKMMEKSYEERFKNSYQIISYINRIQSEQYTFSWKFALINSIKHTSYLLRQNYTHQLLGYIPLVEKESGKVIVITGEQGSGKNRILTLFRYHLLSDEYYLFDYTCTPKNKDPIFALIKEFLSAVKNSRVISDGLKTVSENLKGYLKSKHRQKGKSPEIPGEELIEEATETQKDDSNIRDYIDAQQDTADYGRYRDIDAKEEDYIFARNFLEKLSAEKPLIFIIRVGHHLSDSTVGFLNYISNTIKSSRIMIVLSLDNPGLTSCLPKQNIFSFGGKENENGAQECRLGRTKGLIHTVHIPVEPLTFQQIKEYVTHLLGAAPPDYYCYQLQVRSNGNPSYIRQILVDLIDKKMLLKSKESRKITDSEQYMKIAAASEQAGTDDVSSEQEAVAPDKDVFDFDLDWDSYHLPETIVHNIYDKLSHLNKDSYQALHYLSICHPPLSVPLIQHLLEIGEKESFFLLQDCVNNHILKRVEDLYHFSYMEAKERLFAETGKEAKITISQKVLKYFRDKNVTKISICKGIIKNAHLADDKANIRKYSLLLAQLYTNAGDRESSFELICNVIALDFSKEIKLTQKEKLWDLELFSETAELTGKIKAALSVFNSIPNMPDIFEKYYIKGILSNASENYRAGLKNLEKSLEKAITGKQRINALINIVWSNINLKDFENAEKYIKILDGYSMSVSLKVSYIDRKAVFLFNTGRAEEAIRIMEDFKEKLKPIESTSYYAKTGSFYNNLALFYSSRKFYDKAEHYFTQAKNIWERINYKKSLGASYNNLGDLLLRQGNTKEALEYFNKALDICRPTENLRCEVLTYLNFGEAHIKLGKYHDAEAYLNKALEVMAKGKDKSFRSSIIYNLALAKSKIKSLNYYYRFLKENAAHIFKEGFDSINPLVKSYIQFLLDVGDRKKVTDLLIKNTSLDLSGSKEDEFYHHILGLIHKNNGHYADALSHLNLALSYAEKNRSSYAQSIILCKVAECYIAINNSTKAKEAAAQAEKLIRANRYSYWLLELKLVKIRINLQDEKISLRDILRSLLRLLKDVREREHYMLEIDITHYLSLTYREIKAKRKENEFRAAYFTAIKKAAEGLPKPIQKKFIEQKKKKYENSLLKTLAKPEDSKIQEHTTAYIFAKRRSYSFEPWQEHLYELLKLDETERLKFFIKKMLIQMFSPNYFTLYLTEEGSKKQRPFINYRFSDNIADDKEHIRCHKESLRQNKIITSVVQGCNSIYIPLRFRSIVVGCLVIGDAGELAFTRKEQKLAKDLRLHLTSLLIRIRDITAIEKSTGQMNMLMNTGNEIFSLRDVEKIEQEMVSFCIDFTECSRALLIKRDASGNFVYQLAMDNSKNIISEYSQISKTVLSEVFSRGQTIYTTNAMLDGTLKSSISVQDYSLHSIYCAPVVIENNIHALLYLDNVDNKNIDLQVNTELMKIFLLQISIAIKNAQQYASLMEKNRELHYLDTAKTEFMAIISHELNTPLAKLQSYVSQLKTENLKTEKKRKEVINAADSSVNLIMDKLNDIFSFTKYSLLKQLQKENIRIKDLLQLIINEAELLSKSRNMVFHLEVKDALPPIEANWESLYLMIYQIVLNAIRFTKDFGTIHVGARKSSFQDEEINNRQSLVVYIQDNGVGIPSAELENIFTPFRELNDLYSHQSGTIEFRSSGLGLGLSTAKRIAELHNGKISIKSKEGEGTTVFIILPLTDEE